MKYSNSLNQFVFFILLALLLLHLPFLTADPDLLLSESRGAFTDEGLYSMQVRNLIQQGDLTLNYSDAMAKTPLFSVLLGVFYAVFANQLWVGRLVVLLLSWGIILWHLRKTAWERHLAIFLMLSLNSFYLFHFSHLALAEMLSTACIFAALLLSSRMPQQFKASQSICAALYILAAIFIKIQFAYVLLLLPLSILLQLLLAYGIERQQLFKHLLLSSLVLGVGLVLFYLIWYLPNWALFQQILGTQTANRFVAWKDFPDFFDFLFKLMFWNNFQWWSTLVGLIAVLISSVLFFIPNLRLKERFLWLGIFVWFLLESHKLGFTYYPTRYYISFFFVLGIFSGLGFSALWQWQTKLHAQRLSYGLQFLVLLLSLGFLIKNIGDNYAAYQRRTYSLAKVNQYLKRYDFKGHTILGAWAASLSWGTNAKCIPVWKDYFNDEDPIRQFKPRMVIVESYHTSPNHPYVPKGIHLETLSDSSRFFTVGRWEIELWWMKEEIYQE